MKNKFSIIKLFMVFVIPLFLFQNCSNETGEEIIEDNSKLLEVLKQWGFSEEEIKDYGAYYLVQGDMIFDKDKEYSSPYDEKVSKKTKSKASKSKQRRTAFPVTITDINIFLDPGMNTDWVNASRSAIGRWNAVNSGLILTEVFTAASAHIEIMYDIDDPNIAPLLINVFGLGATPTANGLPGTRTWINENFSFPNICGSAMTQNARIANVQHELGHNLGLHHTNFIAATHIAGTLITDPGSVMNGGQACTISNFSNDDELAIEILFPVPPPPLSLTPGYVSLNSMNPGQTMTIGGTGSVKVTLSGDSGVYLDNGNGLTTTLNLTAPTTFAVYAPQIGPGYGSRLSTVWLRKPDNTVISHSDVNHSY